MTPLPINNKAMWTVYTPAGEIIFSTIAFTKEDSERLFTDYIKEEVSKAVSKNSIVHVSDVVREMRSEYKCLMIAIDIVPIK